MNPTSPVAYPVKRGLATTGVVHEPLPGPNVMLTEPLVLPDGADVTGAQPGANVVVRPGWRTVELAREASPMTTAGLPEAVEPLAFLLGVWVGEGRGAYPTIDDFTYGEESTFVCPGKPVVAYCQQTWVPPGGRPAHAEMGYLRPGVDAVELVVALPSGVVEVSQGTLTGTRLELVTLTVATTPTAKPVREIRRVYELDGDVLSTRLDMAAVDQPIAFHCESELRRAT